MSTANIHDPFFCAITSDEFKRDQIADLAAGRCTAIQVPHLFPDSACTEILTALSKAEFASYGKDRVYPPVMRFGVGVSDHRQNGQVADTYWAALAAGREAWLSLKLPFDPFQMCRDALSANWSSEVAVGCRGGREMGAGVAREPNQGFIIHFDDASREFSGNLLDENLVAQFAFNLYISVPRKGGETAIWRHQWNPADEEYRRPRSYGFDDAVVGDAESFELKPEVGSALLFNPRNYHAVLPSHDSRRVALGFSLGMSDTGRLLAWG
jgi:hypothetical protein